ncbi:MAG TPA: hypothetical protein EYP21_03075 [Syntrophaceae bacterium]|nr:hypothetical protein [Syntrophaceae bacterium]
MTGEINKSLLIDQYLKTERVLRNFFDNYTLSVCIGHCVKTKKGPNCCEDQDSRITEINVNLIGQDILAMRSAKYTKFSSQGCGYLSPHGCILKEYRSPICNTFVCEDLEEYFDRLGPKFGSELKGIERLAVSIFKGFPDTQEENIVRLERMVSTLSQKIDMLLPPNTSVWDYVTKIWRVKQVTSA